jgi:hypothetical protein
VNPGDETPYSWLPGRGLNLIPRNATPTGFVFAASTVMAVQMMLVEVAAIAVVPWKTAPVARIRLSDVPSPTGSLILRPLT